MKTTCYEPLDAEFAQIHIIAKGIGVAGGVIVATSLTSLFKERAQFLIELLARIPLVGRLGAPTLLAACAFCIIFETVAIKKNVTTTIERIPITVFELGKTDFKVYQKLEAERQAEISDLMKVHNQASLVRASGICIAIGAIGVFSIKMKSSFPYLIKIILLIGLMGAGSRVMFCAHSILKIKLQKPKPIKKKVRFQDEEPPRNKTKSNRTYSISTCFYQYYRKFTKTGGILQKPVIDTMRGRSHDALQSHRKNLEY